jgi:predicted Zn-dependent protease
MAHADEAALNGDSKVAIAGYQKALSAPMSKEARGRVAYALVNALWMSHDEKGCAAEAFEQARKTSGTYFSAALFASGVECSDKTMPAKDGADARAALEAAVKSDLYTADDKSDLYEALAELADRDGDAARVTALKNARLQMLEAAAAKAPTPEVARTFDAHRTDLYLDLNRPDDAIRLLTASEKIAPDDYNPPARLARAYLKKGDLTAARAAINRAEKLVYGPRAAVVDILDAEICTAAKDPVAARASYLRAKQVLQAAPPNAGTKMRLQDIDKKLNALGS